MNETDERYAWRLWGLRGFEGFLNRLDTSASALPLNPDERVRLLALILHARKILGDE